MVAAIEKAEATRVEGIDKSDVNFGGNLETGEVEGGIDEDAAKSFVVEVAGGSHGGAEGRAFFSLGCLVFFQPASGLGLLAFDVGGLRDEGFGDDSMNQDSGIVFGDAADAVDVAFREDVGNPVENRVFGVGLVDDAAGTL